MNFDGKFLEEPQRAARPWTGRNAYSRRQPCAPAVLCRTVLFAA